MSDPRNVAHAKKVTQEKKHHGPDARAGDAPAAQPGKKAAAPKKKREPAAVPEVTAAGGSAPSESPAATPSAALQRALAALAKLKEMEAHSRANLEQLAALTVEDELKPKEIADPLGEVYSAQNALQTKLTALIEAYKTECERL